jgi:predicted DNA-binding protein
MSYMTTPQTVVYSFRISPATLARLTTRSAETGATVSALIRLAIDSYLKKVTK